ncbi:MAG: transcriptional regulator, partial [Saprospiraceae bacterium]|nr:transcriptional regulator [Saprospiraceae bacterium]
EDLDQKLILSVIKESRDNHRGNFEGNNVLDFLTHYGLYQNGSFTNACVVLFAKTPAKFLPQIRVHLTEYAEGKNDNALLRNEVFEGNLFTIQDKLERYIS